MDARKFVNPVNWPRPKAPKLFKRLNDPYRMVFIDDATLEEVASFKLTKRSVYVLFSMLFVSIIAITVCILLFTPLKYYIPGYGNNKTRMEVLRLQQTTDSLSDLISAQQLRYENIEKVLNGGYDGTPDTTMLDLAKVRKEQMQSIVPQAKDIKAKAEK